MNTDLPQEQRNARAREAVAQLNVIASLPEASARVLDAVQDPNSTPAALHRVIAQDPALTARILKVVNSAFYRLPGLVSSIDRAIVVLGLNAVKNIAIAASMGKLFRGQRVCGDYTAKDLWRHCVAVAVAARELARETKLPLAEEAFLAGILHDMGLLAALDLFPSELEQVCAAVSGPGPDATADGAPRRSFCDAEREFIGLDHQEAGALLAERWKFPQSCRLVAAYHHRPLDAPAESRLLVSLVYVADTLCCQRAHGLPLTAAGQRLDAPMLADLGLTSAMVERVSADLDALVASASDLLE